MKRIAVLLVANLAEALGQHDIQAAASEPYWLSVGQYYEHNGGVAIIPGMARELIAYATCHHLSLLGLVVVNGDTGYSTYFNASSLREADREFALQVFEAHAHFWFCYLPSVIGTDTEN